MKVIPIPKTQKTGCIVERSNKELAVIQAVIPFF
jgi:hypothetical protein